MPISKSTKKSLRVSRRRFLINFDAKRKLKEVIKKTTAKNISKAFSIIDKCAKGGIIHPNKAARLKSRLAKKVETMPRLAKKTQTGSGKKAKKLKRTVKKK